MNEIEHDTRVIVRDNQPRSLRRQLPAVIRLGCCRIALAFARTEASPKSFIHAIKFAFKNSALSPVAPLRFATFQTTGSFRTFHYSSRRSRFSRRARTPPDVYANFVSAARLFTDSSSDELEAIEISSRFRPDSPLSVGYSIARHVARL